MDVVVAKKRRLARYLGPVIGLFALAGLTAGLAGMSNAPPRVPRATLWIDSVQRGELLREVSAPGSLISDEVRLVTVRVPGLVDRVHVRAGAQVEADTLLIELSNPDLEFAALDAATAVKEARATVLDLRATLGVQQLEHQAEVEDTRALYREAKRRSEASAELGGHELVAALDSQQIKERPSELEAQLKLKEQRLAELSTASSARLAAQRVRVGGLSAQATLRAGMVESLRIRAGARGLLAELDVDVGQQVTTGSVLGKVVNPDKLKAELRVPEARATELAVGQRVQITMQADVVEGRLTRIDPSVRNGNVLVEVGFEGQLPSSARLDLSVDGRVETERIRDALFVNKPAGASSAGTVSLFRVLEDGRTALRTRVRLGRTSVNSVEVLEGLRKGDRVILSDMAAWSQFERIEIE